MIEGGKGATEGRKIGGGGTDRGMSRPRVEPHSKCPVTHGTAQK